jgi:hypothetical protein
LGGIIRRQAIATAQPGIHQSSSSTPNDMMSSRDKGDEGDKGNKGCGGEHHEHDKGCPKKSDKH